MFLTLFSVKRRKIAFLLRSDITVLCINCFPFLGKIQNHNIDSQMGAPSHTKSGIDTFGMVHAANMGQKPGLQHHQVNSGPMEQLHMPGAGIVMSSGAMHGFGTAPGVGNMATSSAPGKGLVAALMQSPAQQVCSCFSPPRFCAIIWGA
jgi:hypothetical protein